MAHTYIRTGSWDLLSLYIYTSIESGSKTILEQTCGCTTKLIPFFLKIFYIPNNGDYSLENKMYGNWLSSPFSLRSLKRERRRERKRGNKTGFNYFLVSKQ